MLHLGDPPDHLVVPCLGLLAAALRLLVLVARWTRQPGPLQDPAGLEPRAAVGVVVVAVVAAPAEGRVLHGPVEVGIVFHPVKKRVLSTFHPNFFVELLIFPLCAGGCFEPSHN